MSNDLVPFFSEGDGEIYRGKFQVPANWTSCGMVVHVAGGYELGDSQPVALAITPMMLSLCTRDGPVVSVLLLSIQSVQVVDLTGLAIPIRTPSGLVDMVPARAKGVSIRHELNGTGTQLELTLYTPSAKTAFEWVNIIQQAMYKASSDLGSAGPISRR